MKRKRKHKTVVTSAESVLVRQEPRYGLVAKVPFSGSKVRGSNPHSVLSFHSVSLSDPIDSSLLPVRMEGFFCGEDV